jgi:GMP synthase (glutamine-hydrolysing)
MKAIDATHLYEQRMLILDFGSQYTQLIARRVRELGFYCEIYPYHIDPEQIEQLAPSGIILSGGPASTTDSKRPYIPTIVLELGCPVLGICYGMQAMVVQLGGRTEYCGPGEFGFAQVNIHGDSKLLHDIEDHTTADGRAILDVWMSHGDQVTTLPEGFAIMASTEDVAIAGIANEDYQFYGLQFHPEVAHTRQGKRILHRFIHHICGCEPYWNPENIVDAKIKHIARKVGNDRVLLGLSGGVDSAITAALLHKAIGDQLISVFVDTGLLRQNEPEYLKATFEANQGIDVVYVDAKDRFLQALEGVVDPETKRKIIGELFIEVFEEQAKQYSNVK